MWLCTFCPRIPLCGRTTRSGSSGILKRFLRKPNPACQCVAGVIRVVGSVVFSLEYVLRLLTIHESTASRKQGLPRGQAMMTWLVSAESIIDLLSFGPFFLEPIIQHALPSLGVLRVLRLVRVSSTHT